VWEAVRQRGHDASDSSGSAWRNACHDTEIPQNSVGSGQTERMKKLALLVRLFNDCTPLTCLTDPAFPVADPASSKRATSPSIWCNNKFNVRSQADTGWPETLKTWNTQGFLWTWKTRGILREFCATSGKIVTNKVFLVRHSNICVKQLLTG